ncbi:retrovirus-related pol polyprotein from transposon TNT 1-94 [Tanacetum coccineum]
MKRKFINLSVLISGYSGNDIDVFLEPLVDDLHALFETGVDTYDASTKDNFNLCAVVLWIINDYPTLGTLCGCQYSGFKGCVVCRKDTNYVRLSASSKQSYVGYRQYLPYNHPFRKQKKAFNRQQEFLQALIPMTGEQIYNEVKHIENKWGKEKENEQTIMHQKTKKIQEAEVKFNIWYQKLKYWRHNPVPQCIDFMHVEKNVAESIVGTLLHVPGKTKDGLNAQLDLAELGVKPELFAMQDKVKTTLPPAGYTTSRKEISLQELDKMQLELVVTLCLLEKFFPPSFFDIMIHLTVHLTREVKLCGPICFRWMYPFERCMKVIKGHVRNRNRPEGCIAEETIAEETIEFFSEYHKTMKTIGIPPDKHVTNENEDGKPLSAGKSSEVSGEVFQKAHLYVIQNTDEIVPYIERHKQVLKTKNPGKRIALLENEHSKSFAKWLREEVERELAISKDSVSETVRWISYGPRATIVKYEAYNINGYTFRTKSNDGIVYQNSGVSVEAVDLHISKETPPKNYKDTYDEVDEEFSTVIHHRNDNVLPLVDRHDLANESRDDYYRKDCGVYQNSRVNVEAIDLRISKEVATTRQAYYYGVLQEIWVLDYRFRQIPLFKCDWVNHKSGGMKRDKLGYTLVDLNNLGHKTPPKNYKDTYDEVDEECSTVIHHRNDNILPLVDRQNIVVNLDSSSDNNNSDSYSTSQISTSEEIDYDSPEPPKSLLKWYHYLSDEYKDNGRFWGSKSGCNESDVKPYWKDIKKAKACMLAKAQASDASSKAKVEARGQDLWSEDTMTFAEEKIGKRKLRKIIDISSDSSDDRRWAAKKASAPVFYGPSTQGLLDAYGYNTIEEYLSWNYFPSTDNESTDMETTDKRNTDKDCIVDSNSAMSKGKYVPVCKKNKPNVYSHVQVIGSVLGLPNVTTWDEIEKKMGARKSKTCADKAKGKRKVSCGS